MSSSCLATLRQWWGINEMKEWFFACILVSCWQKSHFLLTSNLLFFLVDIHYNFSLVSGGIFHVLIFLYLISYYVLLIFHNNIQPYSFFLYSVLFLIFDTLLCCIYISCWYPVKSWQRHSPFIISSFKTQLAQLSWKFCLYYFHFLIMPHRQLHIHIYTMILVA